MFNKKKKGTGYVVHEEYVPARLPGFSKYTEYVPAEYKILNPEYKGQFYRAVDEKLAALTGKMDKHNSGKELHGFIRTQIAHLREDFNHDAAWADYQCERIESLKETQYDKLELEKSRLTGERDNNARKMAPLEGLKAQHEIKVFGRYISLGGIVTLLAMIADTITNFSFLQQVVTMGGAYLFVAVLSMAVMSDCSMSALGIVLSKFEESYMNKHIRTISCIALLAMFILSVAAGPMIRFGSMDIQYGTIDAAGNYIAKESGYSLAEIGITMITSFLTAGTGILSFIFSYDKNKEKAQEYRKLKKENSRIEDRIEAVVTEQNYIKQSPDVRKLDHDNRVTAMGELQAIENGLLAKATMLWADMTGLPETIEKASETIAELLGQSASAKTDTPEPVNHPAKFHKIVV